MVESGDFFYLGQMSSNSPLLALVQRQVGREVTVRSSFHSMLWPFAVHWLMVTDLDGEKAGYGGSTAYPVYDGQPATRAAAMSRNAKASRKKR